MIGGTSFLCKRPSQSKPWNHLQQNHNIVIHGEKHPHTLIICLILFELNITKIHVYCLNPRSGLRILSPPLWEMIVYYIDRGLIEYELI